MAELAYSADELGGLLGVSGRHVRRLGREGVIPAVELGGRIVFPKAAVHRWLDGQSAGRPTRVVGAAPEGDHVDDVSANGPGHLREAS